MAKDMPEAIKMGDLRKPTCRDKDHLPIYFISLGMTIYVATLDQMGVE